MSSPAMARILQSELTKQSVAMSSFAERMQKLEASQQLLVEQTLKPAE